MYRIVRMHMHRIQSDSFIDGVRYIGIVYVHFVHLIVAPENGFIVEIHHLRILITGKRFITHCIQ